MALIGIGGKERGVCGNRDCGGGGVGDGGAQVSLGGGLVGTGNWSRVV